jgi:arrestin-related trafficking adapter 9
MLLELVRYVLTVFEQFERGTVSYFVTATLTRPTTIAPTLSCDRRVLFQDSIDVGHVPRPNARIISLEPISRRGRVKAKSKQTPLDKVQEASPQNGMRRMESEHSQSSNPSSVDQPPLSPAPSDITSTSAVTTSSQSFQVISHSPLTTGGSGRNSETKSASTAASANVITATTELLKPGALPGDVVPVKICVTHTKPNVRGLVIVTLYRQGRIDMHPPIPLTSRTKGKRPEYEDVYPRSRTGLGGLHFSNNSPSSVFRKDLYQTSSMMVINPYTLTADVRASIRIPEDAFPTMVNVPGGMIEFKYYVEVVIDLCGKLGESRFLPRISLTSPPQTFTNTNGTDGGLEVTSSWANNILDTEQLRRGKNIAVCLFEVVVGSRDTTRTTKKWQDGTPSESQRSSTVPEAEPQSNEGGIYDQNGQYAEDYEHNGWHEGGGHWHDDQTPYARFVPPPEPEEEVDEKTRLQRQEALLLPSRPPEDESSSSAAEASVPSAPFIPEEECLYMGHNLENGEDGSYLEHQITPSTTSTRSVDTVVPAYPHSHSPAADHPSNVGPQDDKQELERQRLMAQASAPPEDDSEEAAGPSAPPEGPSAPMLTEEDEYNGHILNHDHHVGDRLPQYRK